MKKIIVILMSLIVININVVYAESVYYINYNGIEMTKEQYNNLRIIFSPEAIDNLTTEEFNKYANSEITVLDDNIQMRSSCYSYPYRGTGCWETSSKRVGIAFITYNNDITNPELHIENTWLTLPSTKKFDLIATRFSNNNMFTITDITGKQSCKNSSGESLVVNYSRTGTNTKESTNGAAIGMNIMDDCTSNITNKMIISLKSTGTKGTFNYYGTYQHGTTNTTLADTHNITFTTVLNGGVLMGGTVVMPSSTAAKFDKMNGVFSSYSYN